MNAVDNARLLREAQAIAVQFSGVKARLTTLEGATPLGGGGGGTWGSITGTLSGQADLQAALDAKQVAGSYLTANQTVTLSGDISGSGATAITVSIGANKVTRGMLAATAGAAILGATGAGNVADLTAAQAKTFLSIAASDVSGLAAVSTSGSAADLSAGTLLAARMPALTGDITTSAGGVATVIGAGKVTLAMQANMATASVVYRKTAGSGAPEVQTLATLKTDLGLTGTNSGDQTITLTGDLTGSGTGSFAGTLATVNSNTGSFGSTTAVPVITVNGKGLITAVSTAALGTAAVKNLSVGTVAPASPAVLDLWVDTN